MKERGGLQTLLTCLCLETDRDVLSENYFIGAFKAKNICLKLNGWTPNTKEKHCNV